jgi:hypothetical protein
MKTLDAPTATALKQTISTGALPLAERGNAASSEKAVIYISSQ